MATSQDSILEHIQAANDIKTVEESQKSNHDSEQIIPQEQLYHA